MPTDADRVSEDESPAAKQAMLFDRLSARLLAPMEPPAKEAGEKSAYVLGGAKRPSQGYLTSAAIPYEQRQGEMLRYGKQKAVEQPTSPLTASATGGLIGAGLGAGMGAILAPGRGLPIGALLGGAGGAFVGQSMQFMDQREIEAWQAAQAGGPGAAAALADQGIRAEVEARDAQMLAHQRRMEHAALQAALRPREVHHHYGPGEGSGSGSNGTPPAVAPSRFICGHCGSASDTGTGGCATCGAPMSRGTKVASVYISQKPGSPVKPPKTGKPSYVFNQAVWDADIEKHYGKPVSEFRAIWAKGGKVPIELAESFDVEDQERAAAVPAIPSH